MNLPNEKKKPSSSTSPVTLDPATDKIGPTATDGTTSFDQGAESEAVSKDTQMPIVLAVPSTSGEEVRNKSGKRSHIPRDNTDCKAIKQLALEQNGYAINAL